MANRSRPLRGAENLLKFFKIKMKRNHSRVVWQNPRPSPFFFRFFSNVSPKLLCCRFFQSACLSTGATLLKLFYLFFFLRFFFFAFRRFWPRPRFFGFSRLFSAFLGLLRRPRFWAKWEPFRASSSQFFIRDIVTFSGAQKRMWFPLLEDLLTPTLPSNIFKPTFSQCLLLNSLQHFHTGMPAFFSFTCCNTTGLHTFCLLLELARTTSTIHPTNFFRLPPVPFRWAWAPPFLTV